MTEAQPSRNDVFVLGAGFSKAIHPKMPLLASLGTEVRGRLGAQIPEIPSRLGPDNFELWLSFLAEEQPWRTEAENLEARAAFLRITEVLRTVLTECVHEARDQPCPPWLLQLIRRWHRDQATVITLNYDPLVEAAYAEAGRLAGGAWASDCIHTQIYRYAMTSIRSRNGAVLGTSQVRTLQLFKLHGSLNWVYSGRTNYYGETIYDDSAITSWKGEVNEVSPATEKVSLIVPPTVGKSGFFQNETVRDQWRTAFTRLRHASQVYCLGYSLPEGDLLLRNLLAAGVSAGAAIIPIDIRPETAARYTEALGTGVDGSFIRATDPIPLFVETYDAAAPTALDAFPHVPA
ncbi:SIR2 family protein [Streptomyces flavidovirens]|uniref:SIR2 family protein n=1 Tax=Streptomyces flavidovirens TaxID=67298 RepID=UPI0034280E3F